MRTRARHGCVRNPPDCGVCRRCTPAFIRCGLYSVKRTCVLCNVYLIRCERGEFLTCRAHTDKHSAVFCPLAKRVCVYVYIYIYTCVLSTMSIKG